VARQLLATGSLSVAQVAHRLGYAEPASFIHAHRRWHGTTPGQVARRPSPDLAETALLKAQTSPRRLF
jgi:AraC-like DNA-binding protein